MPASQLQSFPGWCVVLNYGVLLVVFLARAGAGDGLFRLRARCSGSTAPAAISRYTC